MIATIGKLFEQKNLQKIFC